MRDRSTHHRLSRTHLVAARVAASCMAVGILATGCGSATPVGPPVSVSNTGQSTGSSVTTILLPSGGTGTISPVTTIPSVCHSRPVSVQVSSARTPFRSVCLQSGTTLTVRFVKSGARGTVGAWLSPSPVMVDDPSVLKVSSVTTNGQQATAVFRASSAGETNVDASFGEYCSTPQIPGCTIPPRRMIGISVFVVSRSA